MKKNNLRKNRGQMRVIETILASIIVISALAFVNTYAATPSSQVYEVTDLEKMGYDLFHDLDQHHILVPLVYNKDWSNLQTALKLTLPIDTYFNLTICDITGSRINSEDIIYGDRSTFETSKNTASVLYTLVGFSQRNAGSYSVTAEYQPRILLLQITRG